MKETHGLERKDSNLDFTSLVTEIVDNTKLLAGTGENNLGFVILDMGEGENIVIRIQDADKKEKSIRKLLEKTALEPQSVRKIEIWYNPLQLDDGKLVSTTLDFIEEKWENRTATRLIKAVTYPSEALANPPRRPPPKWLYLVYDIDTIDWSKMPQHTPITTEEAANLLEKIRNKVLTKLR